MRAYEAVVAFEFDEFWMLKLTNANILTSFVKSLIFWLTFSGTRCPLQEWLLLLHYHYHYHYHYYYNSHSSLSEGRPASSSDRQQTTSLIETRPVLMSVLRRRRRLRPFSMSDCPRCGTSTLLNSTRQNVS